MFNGESTRINVVFDWGLIQKHTDELARKIKEIQTLKDPIEKAVKLVNAIKDYNALTMRTMNLEKAD